MLLMNLQALPKSQCPAHATDLPSNSPHTWHSAHPQRPHTHWPYPPPSCPHTHPHWRGSSCPCHALCPSATFLRTSSRLARTGGRGQSGRRFSWPIDLCTACHRLRLCTHQCKHALHHQIIGNHLVLTEIPPISQPNLHYLHLFPPLSSLFHPYFLLFLSIFTLNLSYNSGFNL